MATEKIPPVGFGTYRLKGDECRKAVRQAISLGYRLIDTATIYNNEKQVGLAIQDALKENPELTRTQLFITTKISPYDQGEEQAYQAVCKSLVDLQTDYIDLVLIHWPGASGISPSSKKNGELRMATWRALERTVQEGKVKAIGVSNYLSSHLDELLAACTIRPTVHQFELHPFYQPRDIIEASRKHGLQIQAYSSFGEGALLDTRQFPTLQETLGPISEAHDGAPWAQILLAWARQSGYATLPKTKDSERMRINWESQQLTLSEEEMTSLTSLGRDLKFCWDPTPIV